MFFSKVTAHPWSSGRSKVIHTHTHTYNSKRIRLDQDGLREGQVGGLVQWHALPGQRLQDGPVVQALVVWVRVDVAQHLAVDGRVPEPDHDLWLQVVQAFVVPVEGIFEELRHPVVVRLRQEPLDRGALFGLQWDNEENANVVVSSRFVAKIGAE